MNYNDITISLVLFKSEKVIFKCLNSIKKVKKIIIFDNSNDSRLKKAVIKKYPNIEYILSDKNIGYGAAHNKVFKLAKTRYVFVLNPDTILDKNCIKNLISYSNKINNDFAIISPLTKPLNYGYFEDIIEKRVISEDIIDVDYVQGFSMLIKKNKDIFFDSNIFLYLEEIDLCKRLKKRNNKIFIIKKSKIKHLAAKSSNIGFEFEKCRNWHWMWSNVYFKKKYSNYLITLLKYLPILLFSVIKMIFYFLIFNQRKLIIYYLRASGIYNSLIGKKSWFRPKIKI
jgi:N-acetylglucosaminyl-diphospho-decaprenol L-rhamnosyltransferase